MRWRGVSVRSREGQRGSQKPHSMQRSAVGEIERQRLQVPQVGLGIVVQQHARVQDAVRVEQRA